MSKVKFFFLTGFCLLWHFEAFSYGSAGARATYEPRYIVDMPTAGILPKYGFSVAFQSFSPGGILGEFSASPLTNVNLGISFGGSGIIGSGDITFQSLPGAHLKIRMLDERMYIPAITIGFNSQGRGQYFENAERFSTYSPGAFLTLSKAFNWELGEVNAHGGINYSIEPKPETRKVNFFGGIEHSVGNYVSICMEYNACLDEQNELIRESGGLLNASLKWAISGSITAELQLRDILGNEKANKNVIRFVLIEYIDKF